MTITITLAQAIVWGWSALCVGMAVRALLGKTHDFDPVPLILAPVWTTALATGWAIYFAVTP